MPSSSDSKFPSVPLMTLTHEPCAQHICCRSVRTVRSDSRNQAQLTRRYGFSRAKWALSSNDRTIVFQRVSHRH